MKKILVAADSYVPPEAFKKAFQRIAPENQIRYIQMVEAGRIANSPSEKTIREFTGDPAQIVGELKDEEILAVHTAPVTDEVLQASPNLKLVCCARGGPVNIDIASATKRGILVVSAPGRNADAVADYVLGVMIILARNLRNANLFLVQKKKFDRSTFASFFGHELGGRTLGLIGYGNVGSRVAKRAVAFGMSVLVYDPYIESSKIDAPGIKATDFDTVLRQSDFVSVHARESKENENLIGKRQFELMKVSAYFINSARGSLVDEGALLEALLAKKIAGAGLDVLKSEPISPESALVHLENVFITPHVAGASHQVPFRGAEIIARQIERYIRGQPIEGLMNPELLRN